MARLADSTSFNIVSTVGLVGLTNTATRVDPGTSSRRSSSRFADNSDVEKIDPSQVRVRPGQAGDNTGPDRVFVVTENDGEGSGCRLGHQHATCQRRRLRRPCGEPVRPPAPASDQVDSRPSDNRPPRSRRRCSRFPLGPAETPQTIRCVRRSGVEEPNHRHRWCCARATAAMQPPLRREA